MPNFYFELGKRLALKYYMPFVAEMRLHDHFRMIDRETEDISMPMYEIEMTGISREIYLVEADSEEEAREKANQGRLPSRPYLTEIDSAEITSVRRLVYSGMGDG